MQFFLYPLFCTHHIRVNIRNTYTLEMIVTMHDLRGYSFLDFIHRLFSTKHNVSETGSVPVFR
jgi:hypothetical protein